LNVTIGDREEMNSAQTSVEPRFRGGREDGEEVESRLGIRVQAITRQVRSMPGGRDVEGVMVTSVVPGSVAADAGLIRGLIITRLVAGGQFFDITDVDSFSAAEQELAEGMQIALLVRNANDEFAEAFLPMRVR
jgi:S1-C subfamily serine protease